MGVTREKIRTWAHVREGYWFAPKLYGLGATPVTWQGFALVLGFVLLLLADMRFVEPVAAKTIVAVTLLVSFVVLTWRKTDGGWRWHWGDFEK